jgi:hypothetical protein
LGLSGRFLESLRLQDVSPDVERLLAPTFIIVGAVVGVPGQRSARSRRNFASC